MTIDDIRSSIEMIDHALLTTIALRFEKVRQLKGIKKGPVQDGERETTLRELWKQWAKELSISPEMAGEILTIILEESRHIQQFE